jgi:hypothetical protein
MKRRSAYATSISVCEDLHSRIQHFSSIWRHSWNHGIYPIPIDSPPQSLLIIRSTASTTSWSISGESDRASIPSTSIPSTFLLLALTMRGALHIGTKGTGSTARQAKKLRSTCDRCTALKVRCDKRKPSCERCESMNEICNYGPYRWRATARRVSTPSEPQLRQETLLDGSKAHQITPPIGFSEALAGEDPDDIFQALSGGSKVPSIEDPRSGFEPHSWFTGFFQAAEDFNGIDTSMPASFDIQQPSPKTTSHTALASLDALGTSSATTSTSGLTSPTSNASSNSCRCIWFAFEALQELCLASSTLQRDGNTGLHSSDRIFKMNRAAVQSVDHLVSRDCDTCSEDISMILLQATIGSQALSWYRAVFNGIMHLSSSTKTLPTTEFISFTPTRFGEFELDLMAQRRMKAQFLLCELHRLEKVFNRFNGRSTTNAGTTGTAQGLAQTVSGFLSSGLRDLMGNIDQFCTSNGSGV